MYFICELFYFMLSVQILLTKTWGFFLKDHYGSLRCDLSKLQFLLQWQFDIDIKSRKCYFHETEQDLQRTAKTSSASPGCSDRLWRLKNTRNQTELGPEQPGPPSNTVFTDCIAWYFSFLCLLPLSIAEETCVDRWPLTVLQNNV